MNIIEVYRQFPTQKDCLDHLENVRWKGIPTCPYCRSTRVSPMPKENRHHCNNCNTSYSVTVGTIFHKTKLDCQKWFLAISLILNAKKGISARRLARDIGVNRNTAWYMGMRIRKAMSQATDQNLLKGIVEMDETYIGGKPRKGNNKDEEPNKRGRGTKKTPVVGMIERGGNIKAKVVRKDELTANKLSALVRKNIDTSNTILMTDEYKGYLRMSSFIEHKTINHQEWYVDGDIHTNYIDEFCFRINNRKNSDIFNLTISKALEVRA